VSAAAPPHASAPSRPLAPDGRVAVVLMTHEGRARIGRSLDALTALPERPRVIVVDNGSQDGTPEHVEAGWPEVTIVRLPGNRGVAARNAGVAAAGTPYVAFAEDDSWYEPGALRAAADLLDAEPRLGLVNARVLVGPGRREDPMNAEMAGSALADDPARPGEPIVSFLEGVSIVRREAYEQAGGFDPRLFLGGPEEHLAAELMRGGWELRYAPHVVARHCPDHGEPSPLVRRYGLRNSLLFAWRNRPVGPALRWTWQVLRSSPATTATLQGALAAARRLPRALRERRPVPPAVEDRYARVDERKRAAARGSYGR
jgi:GT2 family glycosyltransferase